MPVGPELARRIGKAVALTDGRHFECPSVQRAASYLDQEQGGANADEHRQAAARIGVGLEHSNSIDDFVAQHTGSDGCSAVVRMAKVAITSEILKAESQSRLVRNDVHPYPDGSIVSSSAGEGGQVPFLAPILKRLLGGASIGEVEARLASASFIVFNYDRCLEQYLSYFLGVQRGWKLDQAAARVNEMDIVHVYGRAGALPGMGGHSDTRTPYGAELGVRELCRVSEGIRTFSEAAEGEVSGRIQAALKGADRVVFLGCGFHRQNLDLLKHEWGGSSQRQVWATGYGLADPMVQHYKSVLVDVFSGSHAVEVAKDKTCRDLVCEYPVLLG